MKNVKKILFLNILIILSGMFFIGQARAATSVSQNENVQSSSTTSTPAAATSVSQNENVQAGSTTSAAATTSVAATNATGSATFPNPLGSVTTVSALLSSILTHLMGVMAIISLIFIIIGGIMYMVSAGNTAMVERAKKTWTGAVIGLAIAMAAPTFLKEIQTILGGNNTTSGNADSWVSSALTIQDIAVNILNLLLSLVGIIAMIAMVLGGLMYLTAAGSEKRSDDGKKIFQYAIIGITVALSALVVIREVNSLLGGAVG